MQERPHKYEVALSEEQRHMLHQLISKGKAPARMLVSCSKSIATLLVLVGPMNRWPKPSR
jgi:hypothetical protein